MKDRISALLTTLKVGTYERDEVIALSLLSALSGESIFMLGLPGVGKSMIARRLKLAFREASVFEYLMSRFSTPDEIFGPVSISKLKNEDCYERVTRGFLPSAEVVFLDEIWKAGPAIQNSLLTVLNEKIYLNGNHELQLPVKAIIAASNELPAEGEGLEALWDRFLLRYIVQPIKHKNNFFRLIDNIPALSTQPSPTSTFETLTQNDYDKIRSESNQVKLPDSIKELLYGLRQKINELPKDYVDNEEEEDENAKKEKYYVSDRRWKKIVGVLRTSAYLNGRNEVDLSDICLLEFMLWDNDILIPKLNQLISESIVVVIFADALKAYKAMTAPKNIPKTDGQELFTEDGVYYRILCDDFILKIRIEDYDKMRHIPQSYFFASETNDGSLVLLKHGQFCMRVSKPGYVCINSYNYPLQTVDGALRSNPHLLKVREELDRRIYDFKKNLDSNLFTCESSLRKNIRDLIDVYRKRFCINEESPS